MVAKIIEKWRKRDWHYEKGRMAFHEETRKFAKAFKENFTTLMISAFGLTAALIWQDAIRTFINTIAPIDDPQNYALKFYAAVVVSFVAITATYFLSKLKTNGQ